ncbi:hypothetical protein QFC22_006596 [Naganishia vaughanmartiniae]|uniref:Uncharacterized protein n=1 Tax=Naganishia vaughanmartiniae TaxID=1424756 RepID=A0ACC2WK77_9TREE|nr:hypothetical protein QFC22_006596 [Naganishia vaughanmartiniae]
MSANPLNSRSAKSRALPSDLLQDPIDNLKEVFKIIDPRPKTVSDLEATEEDSVPVDSTSPYTRHPIDARFKKDVATKLLNVLEALRNAQQSNGDAKKIRNCRHGVNSALKDFHAMAKDMLQPGEFKSSGDDAQVGELLQKIDTWGQQFRADNGIFRHFKRGKLIIRTSTKSFNGGTSVSEWPTVGTEETPGGTYSRLDESQTTAGPSGRNVTATRSDTAPNIFQDDDFGSVCSGNASETEGSRTSFTGATGPSDSAHLLGDGREGKKPRSYLPPSWKPSMSSKTSAAIQKNLEELGLT